MGFMGAQPKPGRELAWPGAQQIRKPQGSLAHRPPRGQSHSSALHSSRQVLKTVATYGHGNPQDMVPQMVFILALLSEWKPGSVLKDLCRPSFAFVSLLLRGELGGGGGGGARRGEGCRNRAPRPTGRRWGEGGPQSRPPPPLHSRVSRLPHLSCASAPAGVRHRARGSDPL